MELETTQQILGALAILVGLIGYIYYIIGIFNGSVKPHPFTWFIWGILTSVAFFAQVTGGAGPGAWVTGMTAFMSFCFMVTGLQASSRKYITKSDWYIFISTLISIPIWYTTGNPLLAVILITIIDAAAFIPTFRKAYYYPETENVYTYALSSIKFIIAMFAIQNITLITSLYPISLILANGIFVAMIFWRK